MSIISLIYRKKFVNRYDKDGIVPYATVGNFEGLLMESYSFNSSDNIVIKYFYYYLKNYDENKIVLFCPGIGPGHTAYFQEIYKLALKGYKVITLDYEGCGESGGKGLKSMSQPSKNVLELLSILKLKVKPIIVGHSLGAFTALNILNLRDDIEKGVIISGFIKLENELKFFAKNSKFISKRLIAYERNINKELYDLDNFAFLKSTKKKLFFIHSTDDQLVPYNDNLGKLYDLNNPSLVLLTIKGKKHNPNYDIEALNFMTNTFAEYNSLVKNKKLKTKEQKIEFFKDKSPLKMTVQDEVIWNKIYEFLDI